MRVSSLLQSGRQVGGARQKQYLAEHCEVRRHLDALCLIWAPEVLHKAWRYQKASHLSLHLGRRLEEFHASIGLDGFDTLP